MRRDMENPFPTLILDIGSNLQFVSPVSLQPTKAITRWTELGPGCHLKLKVSLYSK